LQRTRETPRPHLGGRGPDLAAEVLRLTGGTGVDLVLESAGGATLGASLTAAKRVTGRVIVYGVASGEAPITNWELIYKHQVHIIGLNIGVLIQAVPQIFGEIMGELFALIAAGVLTPGQLDPVASRSCGRAGGKGSRGPARPGGYRYDTGIRHLPRTSDGHAA